LSIPSCSRLDIGVQADGYRLAVNHGLGDGIAPRTGDYQGFAEADGVGFSRSISMQSLLPLISTFIAIGDSPVSSS